MKQTAVEWYFDKIKSHFEHDGDLYETFCMTYAIAKQKEREQTIHAYKHGQNNGFMYSDGNGLKIEAEQYYNETYSKGENKV
jgi:hypothetical protein